MTTLKQIMTARVCYTALVYNRINKKLGLHGSNEQIENLIADILKETDEKLILRKGKNYYISNAERNIRLTINSNTFRVITADKLKK
ncbi:MAG: DUF3781 domain-containing protein [Lentimicrobiaceae bacterium]|nr:DUF3781 domain-containing protein [Lentimicrobiaceae bacterium]MCO5266658.1 DUF3781 domain-containing protein [Lentimicrobium sp.]HPG33932.1 DUF3781 domain-containing protein [Lentimicrobium sp.]